MGISTDAILYYGADFYDAEEGTAFPEWLDDGDGGLDVYELEKWLLANHPSVSVVSHCSGDYPIHALCTASLRAWRGDPKRVGGMLIPDGSSGAIASALEGLGVEVDMSDIGWHLASYTD